MERTHLSDIFKFIHGFGQKGHQIGRKIGDALELLVLGMVHRCPQLAEHLILEPGVEGATTAEHKVEFAFYKFGADRLPSRRIADLFGIIECKKVGVEVTIKQSFKSWRSSTENAGKLFCETHGYSFGQNAGEGESRKIQILPETEGGNIRFRVSYSNSTTPSTDQIFDAKKGDKFLLTSQRPPAKPGA